MSSAAHHRKLVSKQELMELQYRGGFEEGFATALREVEKRLGLGSLEAHLKEVRSWAEDDPTIPTDPPALDGELRDVSRA